MLKENSTSFDDESVNVVHEEGLEKGERRNESPNIYIGREGRPPSRGMYIGSVHGVKSTVAIENTVL